MKNSATLGLKIEFLKLLVPVFLSSCVGFGAKAESFSSLVNGNTLQPVPVEQMIADVVAGSVIILGESHGLAAHRDQHIAVLQALRDKGLKISVGLEFLNYPDQAIVTQYLRQELAEDEFLKAVKWQGFGFEFYKQQLLFPNISQGETALAINIPRYVTSKIAKTGIDSLNEDEKKLIPPQFQAGRDSYKKRFAAIMHVPEGPVLDRYFVAQSVWDDTMAWQAVEFLDSNPDQTLVIVVGEFHAQYGGGLADRIKARRPKTPITTLSQIHAVKYSANGKEVPMTEEELRAEIQPSEVEGSRGDYIWMTRP